MAKSEVGEWWLDMKPKRRREVLKRMDKEQQRNLEKHWEVWANEGQLPPEGFWHTWLIMAGRGYGKTRAGAEWVRAIAEADPTARIALVGASLGEARRVMVEGPSGLLAIARPQWRPHFEPSKRQLAWPNGAMATLFSGQAQKEFYVNQAHALTDAMLNPAIEGETAAPPAGAAEGDCWLVAAGASGEWVGREGMIACLQSGVWLFVAGREGMRVFDRSTEQFILYRGGWQRPVAPDAPGGGSVVDAEARGAIDGLIASLVDAGVFRGA